ncbi:MAG: hypothetical protein NC453_10595 [Muribaculum sp.]|nr:hypothetical protein [Muribaculum sp.]
MVHLILILVSLLVISVYLVSYVCHCGLPTSVSSTYYNTRHKWFLPVVLSVAIATAIVPFFDLTPDYWRFLVFLIVAGILFIAAAPAFRQEFEGKVHAGSAIIAGASAVAWLSIMSGFPWIAIAGVVGAVIDWKHKVFWIEVGILLNLYVALILFAA